MPDTQTSESNLRSIQSVDNRDRDVSIIYLPGVQRQNNVEAKCNKAF
jgi:hypothetical protein